MSISPLARLVAICLTPGIGGVTLRALLDHFGDIDAVYGATPEALCDVPGIGPRTAAAIHTADPDRTSTEIAQAGISEARTPPQAASRLRTAQLPRVRTPVHSRRLPTRPDRQGTPHYTARRGSEILHRADA